MEFEEYENYVIILNKGKLTQKRLLPQKLNLTYILQRNQIITMSTSSNTVFAAGTHPAKGQLLHEELTVNSKQYPEFREAKQIQTV
jgi:hypothetical protein